MSKNFEENVRKAENVFLSFLNFNFFVFKNYVFFSTIDLFNHILQHVESQYSYYKIWQIRGRCYKHWYLIHTWSDKAFKGTVVNSALSTLNGGLFQITLTVPLIDYDFKLDTLLKAWQYINNCSLVTINSYEFCILKVFILTGQLTKFQVTPLHQLKNWMPDNNIYTFILVFYPKKSLILISLQPSACS